MTKLNKKVLRDGESNPGLPRDRRGYSPLYYRGVVHPFVSMRYKLTLEFISGFEMHHLARIISICQFENE